MRLDPESAAIRRDRTAGGGPPLTIGYSSRADELAHILAVDLGQTLFTVRTRRHVLRRRGMLASMGTVPDEAVGSIGADDRLRHARR